MSWEVCGRARMARKIPGGFWDELTGGLVPSRGMLATSEDGNRVVMLDFTQFLSAKSERRLVLCTSSGDWLRTLTFPFRHRASATIAHGDQLLSIGQRVGDDNRFGVWRTTWTDGEWAHLYSLSEEHAHRETVTTDGTSVLVSDRGQIVDVSRQKVIAQGDCPRLSPHRRFLYFRDGQGYPCLRSWPDLTELRVPYAHRVGTCAEWSPESDWILLETLGPILPRLKVVQLTSGLDLDVGGARMSGTSGHAFRWIDWGEAGPEAMRRFEARYLQGQVAYANGR